MTKEQGGGILTDEICCTHEFRAASFNKYKVKFGGMEVSNARKLKVLEDENAAAYKQCSLNISYGTF